MRYSLVESAREQLEVGSIGRIEPARGRAHGIEEEELVSRLEQALEARTDGVHQPGLAYHGLPDHLCCQSAADRARVLEERLEAGRRDSVDGAQIYERVAGGASREREDRSRDA